MTWRPAALLAMASLLLSTIGIRTAAAADSSEISITASGDILTHNTLYSAALTTQGYDFVPQLRAVTPLLTGDVNICQLETPLTNGTPSNYPVFATPVELAAAIKQVGFNGCSFASNHALDQGPNGVVNTLTALRAAGLVTAGSRINRSDYPTGWYKLANGLQVAQVSYTYGLNGFRLPADQPWLVNVTTVSGVLNAAKRARERGADLVVVTLHWGAEYSSVPTSKQQQIARSLTASPYVDVIIGHHTHVFQPAELINGKPVIFGLGNLWSGQNPAKGQPRGQHGAVVKLNFAIDETGAHFVGGRFTPTLVIRKGWKLAIARSVTDPRETGEACRSILDAAKYFRPLLIGPKTC